MQEADSPSRLPVEQGGGSDERGQDWQPGSPNRHAGSPVPLRFPSSRGLSQVVPWKPWLCILVKCVGACLEIGYHHSQE